MPAGKTLKKIARRTFLIGGAAVTGGLIIGYAILREKPGTAGFEDWGTPGQALNAWVKITPQGEIILGVARAEMGQGVYTSLAMLIAEELEVDFSRIRVEHTALDGKYINKYAMREQTPISFPPLMWVAERMTARIPMVGTGASYTIRDAWTTMPRAGAAAREMLMSAAADRWNVPRTACAARWGQVINLQTHEQLSYGELAMAAAALPIPSNPPLKDPSDYSLVGTPVPRVDTPEKVTGNAAFGIDINFPDQLYAALRPCPYLRGRLISYDAAPVEAMPGVFAVVAVDNSVAVVADSTWRARQAANALNIEFAPADGPRLDSATIMADYHRALDEPDELFTIHTVGDTPTALTDAATTITADYEVPYLAHACMEPMNCTVKVDGDRAEVWIGSQSPTMATWGVADGAGVERDNVTCHITYMGGGFGRRVELDWAQQAGQIARAVEGRPVKLLWSREDDMIQDVFRPAAVARLTGALDSAGMVRAMAYRVVTQPLTINFIERAMPDMFSLTPEQDGTMTEGVEDSAYQFANFQVEKVAPRLPLNIGNWRSVGHSFNAFFIESFIDELAAGAQRDPLQVRRELLAGKPRHLAVLDLVAAKAGWDQPLGANQGRGLALHESFGSIVAQVADVSITADNKVRVDKVVCVVDCGSVVNPDTVEAQMESGIVFGLSAALYGEITIRDSQVVQQNFPQYPVVRLSDMPVIETHIVPSTEYPGGIGEPGTPPIAPAVTNAIYAATGTRVRRLPIKL